MILLQIQLSACNGEKPHDEQNHDATNEFIEKLSKFQETRNNFIKHHEELNKCEIRSFKDADHAVLISGEKINTCLTDIKENPDNMKEKFCLDELKMDKDNIKLLESTLERIIKCIKGGKNKKMERAAAFGELNRISTAFSVIRYNHTVNSRFEKLKNSLHKSSEIKISPSQEEIDGKSDSTQQETGDINKNNDHSLPESANNSETKASEVPSQEVPAKIDASNSNGAPVQEISTINSETTTTEVLPQELPTKIEASSSNGDPAQETSAKNSETTTTEVPPQELPAKVEANSSNGETAQEIPNISETTIPQEAVDIKDVAKPE